MAGSIAGSGTGRATRTLNYQISRVKGEPTRRRPAMLEVTSTIRIPLDEFAWSFARSGGPGGRTHYKGHYDDDHGSMS